MRVPGNSVMPTIRALQTAMDKAATGKGVTPLPRNAKPEAQDPQVKISGQALAKQRLFDVIGTRVPAQQHFSARTHQDQQLLGDVYEWASEQGVELGYVDSLGRDLANYRRGLTSTATTTEAASEAKAGLKQAPTSRLNFREEAVVKRLLASDALKTTRLDAGFIQHATRHPNADRSPNQLEFMETVTNRFSAQADKAPPLGQKFSSRVGRPQSSASPRETATALPADGTAGTKRKPLTLESLRLERVQAAMSSLGVKSLSQLWDSLMAGTRFRR